MNAHHDADPLIHLALGQWVLEVHMASGRFSEVYRAVHGESGASAVIKVLKPNLDDPREGERALAREEEALSVCSHPGIPQFMRRGEVAGRKALMLSYCPGHHMLRLVQEVPQFDRVGVLRAVARMLAHVHGRNYVHGDISLENILMAATGRVYLTGFSNARRIMSAGSEIITRVFRRKTHIGGPFTYLAPEIMGAKNHTPASDVFAFGVSAFLMLTKRRPYPVKSKEAYLDLAKRKERADILRHHPKMPRGFASIINRCVAMDPELRFKNADELNDTFEMYFAQKGSPKASELSKQFVPPENPAKKGKDADKDGEIRWMD